MDLEGNALGVGAVRLTLTVHPDPPPLTLPPTPKQVRLAEALRHNRSVTELLLGGPRPENEYPEQVAAALVEALQINPLVEKVAPHELA